MSPGMDISDYAYAIAIVAVLVPLWIHEKVVIATGITLRTRRRTHHDYADYVGEIAGRDLAGV
jgi:hypothetical protein